jgi:hypothetical protein
MKTTSQSVDWLEDEIDPDNISSDWDRESGAQSDRSGLSDFDLKELRQILFSILSEMESRPKLKNAKNNEAFVIASRFGFFGNEPTFEEIGKTMGLTRDRVSQIEKKGLRLLRHPTRIKRLEAFFYGEDIKLARDSGGRNYILKTSAGIEITLTLNEETGKPTMSFNPEPPYAVALLESIKVEFLPWFNDIRKKWMRRTGKVVELAK